MAMNRLISATRPALLGAAIALLIVVLALVGLARLTGNEPASPARTAAPPAEFTAGTVVFDTDVIAAERRRDVVGALLMSFALGGALFALTCGGWACFLAWRTARGAHAESGSGQGEGGSARSGLARGN